MLLAPAQPQPSPGLVDTFSIPRLMRLIAIGRRDSSLFAMRRLALEDTMAACDTFADPSHPTDSGLKR